MKAQRFLSGSRVMTVVLLLAAVGLVAAGLVAAAAFVAEALGIPTEFAFGLLLPAFGVLVYLLGTLLPKRLEASATSQLPHAPAAVWQVLIDDGGIPAFPALGSVVERLPDHQELPVWRVTYTNGHQRVYGATEFIAPRRLAVDLNRHEGGPDAVSGGSSLSGGVEWDLEEHAGGSRVTVTSSVVMAKPLGRPALYLTWVFLRWSTVSGLRQNLKILTNQLAEPPAMGQQARVGERSQETS